MSPNSASSQSGVKVGCLIDVSATATANTNHLEIHDAVNAAWHRGAARTVTVTTAATTTITFAAGQIGPADLRRPISGTGIVKTAFIRSVLPAACTAATCTSAVLSVAGTALAAHAVTLEHSTSRVLADAHYTAGATSTLTSATAGFVAADVNKSVSGGAFSGGARISAVTNATTATVTTGATAAVVTPAVDTITLGATQYTAASPSLVTTYTETYNREMAKTPGTASCAGSTLTITAAGGGVNAGDVGLKVTFLNAAATVAGTWKINATTATTATLSAACPAAAAWTNVVIGAAGANAPKNGATVASLTAALNLNPALNATSDDCNKNTYDGFQVIGAWNNPGAFTVTGVLGAAPDRSIGQVLFPTSVIAFAGFIVPKASDAHQAGAHFSFVFPTLPTSLAVCPIVAGNGTTTTKTAITLGFFSTTLSTAPSLATGSGNPASPPVREIGPSTGLFGQKVSLFNGTTQLGADIAPTGCTVIANTAVPTFSCGLG